MRRRVEWGICIGLFKAETETASVLLPAASRNQNNATYGPP